MYVWKLQALLNLSVDPFVGVAEIAKKIVNGITLKVGYTDWWKLTRSKN